MRCRVNSVPSMWRVQDLEAWARPNLWQANIFVGHKKPLKITGGASHLNGTVIQTLVFGGGFSTHRMTTNIEVISTTGGIPEIEFGANPGGVLRHKIRNGGLRAQPTVIAHGIDGKGHKEHMGQLRAWGNQGTL